MFGKTFTKHLKSYISVSIIIIVTVTLEYCIFKFSKSKTLPLVFVEMTDLSITNTLLLKTDTLIYFRNDIKEKFQEIFLLSIRKIIIP